MLQLICWKELTPYYLFKEITFRQKSAYPYRCQTKNVILDYSRFMSSVYSILIVVFFSFVFVTCRRRLNCYRCDSITDKNCITFNHPERILCEKCKINTTDTCMTVVMPSVVTRGCGFHSNVCEDYAKCSSCSTDFCNNESLAPVDIFKSSHSSVFNLVQALYLNTALQIIKMMF